MSGPAITTQLCAGSPSEINNQHRALERTSNQPSIELLPERSKSQRAQSPRCENLRNIPSPHAPSKIPPALHKLASAHPLSILLAEDNPVSQQVTGSYLKQFGYRFDLATDGHEVVRMMREKQPVHGYDVIFMDLQMPGMGGLEATRVIRATYAREEQPIIVALTANEDMGDTLACMQSGMEYYLAKPVTPLDMAHVLVKIRARTVHSPLQRLMSL